MQLQAREDSPKLFLCFARAPGRTGKNRNDEICNFLGKEPKKESFSLTKLSKLHRIWSAHKPLLCYPCLYRSEYSVSF